ncbi:hypothetical protein PR003_g24006 [Phytophthora rubi]|uniref:Uncharacterized protein n=1 Tax=Phytophthora rubi TaxID=129364 RepID=A0A6A3IVA1_9STRA|nr:hypothetical protein PR001_g22818 [Phytophthora rubi]KAE9014060.1 hypothetical protein PR002_g14336 [Phytophthora rubi]KAE9295474.1 hypothetical protein PR003_g24006 [Phytophthora rubi]
MASDPVPKPPAIKTRQLNAMAPNAAWKSLPLTPEVIQAALTAVSYKTNYARTVASRFCLHYINSIRTRADSSGVVSYLLSVDGCESSQVVSSGRCDIYYCKPYTYEVQLAQKSAGSSDYGVLSLCKTQDQKSADDIRGEWSNLDIFGVSEPGVGAEEPVPEEPVEVPVAPAEVEQPYIVLPPLPGGAIVLPGRPDLDGTLVLPPPVPPVQVNNLVPAPVPNYPVVVPEAVSVQNGPPNSEDEGWIDDGPDALTSDVDWTSEDDPDTPIDNEEAFEWDTGSEQTTYEYDGSGNMITTTTNLRPIESWDGPYRHGGNAGAGAWATNGAYQGDEGREATISGEMEFPTEYQVDAEPEASIGDEATQFGGEPKASVADEATQFDREPKASVADEAAQFNGAPKASVGDEETPISWTGGVENNVLQESQPFSTEVPIAEPISLRANAVISSRAAGVSSAFAPALAGVGVAIVLVVSLVVVRLRARTNRTTSEEHAPLRSAPVATEHTVSEASKTGDTEPDLENV